MEHRERATLEIVTDWQIPTEDKAVLVEVGVPHVEHLVTRACFQTEAQPTLHWHEEDDVLAELKQLSEELKEFDPDAFDGDHDFL
ncbi:hypothetical protein [Streptomyces sp. NPDC017230]|uniref:hypothetical protein n=1 Tax=unclassified Streptomyces TaxID=2593676 RepID=UPI0037AA4BD7